MHINSIETDQVDTLSNATASNATPSNATAFNATAPSETGLIETGLLELGWVAIVWAAITSWQRPAGGYSNSYIVGRSEAHRLREGCAALGYTGWRAVAGKADLSDHGGSALCWGLARWASALGPCAGVS